MKGCTGSGCGMGAQESASDRELNKMHLQPWPDCLLTPTHCCVANARSCQIVRVVQARSSTLRRCAPVTEWQGYQCPGLPARACLP